MSLRLDYIDDEDAAAVVALWNNQLTVPNTGWRFSNRMDEETLARIQTRSRIVVLKSDGNLIGFGIWNDKALVGIVAQTRDEFCAILRFICEQQTGKQALLVTNGAESLELEWIRSLGVRMSIAVVGYKPLTHEDTRGKTREHQLKMRKPWIRHLRSTYDHIKEQIDKSQAAAKT